MKRVHSPSIILMLAAAALACSCSDDSNQTESAPIIGAVPGGAAGGAAAGAGGSAAGAPGTAGGGTAAGSAGGATGSLSGLSTGSPSGTAGGSPAGGTIGTVTVEKKPCEKKVRTAGKTIPDFMIVLDRSLSMRPDCRTMDFFGLPVPPISPDCVTRMVDCAMAPHMGTTICGGTMPSPFDRWAPAVDAIKSLTMMFQTKVNFGLTIFPGGNGGMGMECAAGTQRVATALNTAGAIGMALDGTQPAGYTPTGPTLQNVLMQIQGKKTSPDEVLQPQFVLLVTDGAPTCVGNNFQPNSPQPHQATIMAIDALAKAGVKTYVIGYDASVDAMLAAQLTEYAQHGGTNNFYAVQDGPSLVAKFAEITGVVAECSYALDKKPDDKKFVLVELDGNKLTLDDPNGWVITDNNVTIQGDACTTLRDGARPHTLAVTVECVPQVPL
jgi:hypothetical protein